MDAATSDIAHIIELAVAPVFLIAGIGALLNVLTARLGRVVDRGRALEAALAADPEGEARDRLAAELKAVASRTARINIAVTLATLAALLVCLVVVFLFAGELFHANLSRIVAVLFIATMSALIAALCFFLGEIGIAIRTLRIGVDHAAKRRG
jgi:hypothetical protein